MTRNWRAFWRKTGFALSARDTAIPVGYLADFDRDSGRQRRAMGVQGHFCPIALSVNRRLQPNDPSRGY